MFSCSCSSEAGESCCSLTENTRYGVRSPVAGAGCYLGAHAPATGAWWPVCCCGLSLGHCQLVSVTLHSASAQTESPGRGQPGESSCLATLYSVVRGQIIASLFVTVFVAHNQSGNQHNRTVEQWRYQCKQLCYHLPRETFCLSF